MSLWQELRRRNVFKVGFAYFVLCWLVVQITDTIAPALGLPDWTLTLIIWLSAVGLPFAILFAWAFEMTPEGIKRTDDVEPSQSITRKTGTKLNFVIIGLLATIIAVLLVERFWFQSTPVPEEIAEIANDADGYASIAVLPFANMSEDPANEYFGDGLAEELLNLLAKVEGLKVAARTSSFYFKDKNPTIEEVAKALGVDTVVEGSVRRSGDTIRVVVQLILADDSSHLWSERYDRPLTDIFEVQDDIANEIMSALMPELGIEERPNLADTASKISPEDFEQFLVARRLYYTESPERAWAARDGFLEVTKSSPSFAPAWAWLARSVLVLENFREIPESEARAIAREAIDTALMLDPESALAYLAEGQMALSDFDWEPAITHLEKAATIEPNNVDVLVNLEHALFHVGRTEEAIEALEKAMELDPLHPDVLWNLAHQLNLKGQISEAFSMLESLYEVDSELAFDTELHLYTDSGSFGRALYASGARDVPDLGTRTYIARVLGLHDHPFLLESEFRSVSLAVLGEEELALDALEELGDIVNDHRRSDVEWMTYMALEDFDKAQELLMQRWELEQSEQTNVGFDMGDLFAFGALLIRSGEQDVLRAVNERIQEMTEDLSPIHAGSYHYLKAYASLVNGDLDDALGHLQALADRGDAGSWSYGTALPFPWLFEGDARYDDVIESFTVNREAQLEEFRRLERSGLNVEQLRSEYLSNLESAFN